MSRPPRSNGPRPATTPRPNRHGGPSWRRIFGLLSTAVALGMMACIWLAPETLAPSFALAPELVTEKFHLIAYIGAGAVFTAFICIISE